MISKLGEFNLLIISVATRPNMKSHPVPGFTNHPIPMSNMVATTHVNEPKQHSVVNRSIPRHLTSPAIRHITVRIPQPGRYYLQVSNIVVFHPRPPLALRPQRSRGGRPRVINYLGRIYPSSFLCRTRSLEQEADVGNNWRRNLPPSDQIARRKGHLKNRAIIIDRSLGGLGAAIPPPFEIPFEGLEYKASIGFRLLTF